MIYNKKIFNRNIYNKYNEYIEDYSIKIIPKDIFQGFFIVFYNKNGYVKYKYAASSGLKLINEIVFSFSENGTDKAKIRMLKEPNELGFNLLHNDFIEIYMFKEDLVIWSGVVSKLTYEYRTDKIYEFEAVGFYKRLQNLLINQVYNNNTIYNIIIDVINKTIEKDNRYYYLPNEIKDVPGIAIENLKFDNKKISECLKQIENIAGNYKFWIGGDRVIKFFQRDTSIKNIIFIDNKNIKVNKFETTNIDKIKNIIVVERKSSSGSGVVDATGSIGSISDNVYALNGIIKVQDSINNFGEYYYKLQVPETVNDITALNYGIQYALLNAYPRYMFEFEMLLNELDNPILPNGFIRVYGQKRDVIEILNNCEDLNNWVNYTNGNLELSSNSLYGRKALKLSGNILQNDYLLLELNDIIEIDTLKQLSFWLNSNSSLNLEVIFFDENQNPSYNINFKNNYINKYELIRLIYKNDFKIKYIIFKFKENYNNLILYLDMIEGYFNKRYYYDLEIKEVEYNLNPYNWNVKIKAGSIEVPFVDTFVEAFRMVESLKLTSKAGG